MYRTLIDNLAFAALLCSDRTSHQHEKDVLKRQQRRELCQKHRNLWCQEFRTYAARKNHHGFEETTVREFLQELGAASHDVTLQIKEH
ncbi:hypothetical protein Hypma_002890 [Hypsizygus marmoreus]|uniref:Uncharacterized protein n=1 Tax=Hypsizygus marmoreus TaxID=39966 RepID=A0A369J9W0_HYPMA|nr:hypothetical protein Hypma_002890 [Hypsizygus marmoreus]